MLLLLIRYSVILLLLLLLSLSLLTLLSLFMVYSQWKFHKVALEMLLLLVRCDVRLPTSAVQLFVNNLINSTINVRKVTAAAAAGCDVPGSAARTASLLLLLLELVAVVNNNNNNNNNNVGLRMDSGQFAC